MFGVCLTMIEHLINANVVRGGAGETPDCRFLTVRPQWDTFGITRYGDLHMFTALAVHFAPVQSPVRRLATQRLPWSVPGPSESNTTSIQGVHSKCLLAGPWRRN
jgi:hypothetical protein